MGLISEINDVIGQQNTLGGLQEWAKNGGAQADPDFSNLAQLAPRAYEQLYPALIKMQLGGQAANQLAGNSSPSPTSALSQLGSSGDQTPNAPIPQSLPAQGDSQSPQPPQQSALLRMLPALTRATGGDLPAAMKILQDQRALSIPPGVTLPQGTEFVNGQVMPIPGAAQAAAQQEQTKKTGETTGTNLAEAQKTLSVMQSNLPSLNARLDEMKQYAVGNPQAGIAPASYGPNWLLDENGEGPIADYHNSKTDQTAVSNAMLKQRAAQGVLPELGPQLSQAGIKGNKFLEQLATSASGIPMNASPDAKAAAIEGLRTQYMRNMQATQQQVQQLGGQTAPQQLQPSNNQPDPRLLAHLKQRGLLGQ